MPRLLVAIALALTVFSVTAAYAFVSPRPYSIQESDGENTYYYGGRLILEGQQPPAVHPGTPIFFLSAALLKIIGSDVSRTQTVLNIGYMIIGLVNALALAFFIMRLPKKTPASVALLCGGIIITLPPFLSHLNYFTTDAFLIAATLPPVILLWNAFLGEQPLTKKLLIIAGIMFGFATAIKLTILLTLIAASVALLPPLMGAVRRATLPRYSLFLMPLAASVSFVFFTLPMLPSYPQLFGDIFLWLHHPPSRFVMQFAFIIICLIGVAVWMHRRHPSTVHFSLQALFHTEKAPLTLFFLFLLSIVAHLCFRIFEETHILFDAFILKKYAPDTFFVLLAAFFVLCMACAVYIVLLCRESVRRTEYILKRVLRRPHASLFFLLLLWHLLLWVSGTDFMRIYLFYVLNHVPLFFFTTVIAMLAASLLWLYRECLIATAPPSDTNAVYEQIYAPFFLLLLGVVTLFVLYQSDTGRAFIEPGLQIRYILPSILFVPLLVHYVLLHSGRTRHSHVIRSLTVATAVALLVPAITTHARLRSQSIERRTTIATHVEEMIQKHTAPGDRVALWLSGSNSFGAARPEATFHFWGNHSYGKNTFDEELLEAFPDSTFFYARIARHISEERGRSALSNIPPPQHETQEIVMGEKIGIRPSLVLFPLNEVDPRFYVGPLAGLQPLLQERMDACYSLSRVFVGGYTWIFLTKDAVNPPDGKCVLPPKSPEFSIPS